MERKLEVFVEDGKLRIEGGKFTVAEILNIGQGIINLAQGLTVDLNPEKKEVE